MNWKRLLCAAGVGGLCAGAGLRGADTKDADPDLPQPLDPNVAASILQTSPFTRALDLSDNLMLTGIAYVKGQPVATVEDKSTQQRYLVSEQPNAQGWRLTEASASNEPRLTHVKLMVGSEIVTIHYSEGQLTPTTKGYVTGKVLTEKDYLRHDEKGQAYVSGSAYLSEEDRDRYHKGISREAHDKFREIIRANRDKMFSSSPEERAAFAKKVLDTVDAQDKAKRKK